MRLYDDPSQQLTHISTDLKGHEVTQRKQMRVLNFVVSSCEGQEGALNTNSLARTIQQRQRMRALPRLSACLIAVSNPANSSTYLSTNPQRCCLSNQSSSSSARTKRCCLSNPTTLPLRSVSNFGLREPPRHISGQQPPADEPHWWEKSRPSSQQRATYDLRPRGTTPLHPMDTGLPEREKESKPYKRGEFKARFVSVPLMRPY